MRLASPSGCSGCSGQETNLLACLSSLSQESQHLTMHITKQQKSYSIASTKVLQYVKTRVVIIITATITCNTFTTVINKNYVAKILSYDHTQMNSAC